MRASIVLVFAILLGAGCVSAYGQTAPTAADPTPLPSAEGTLPAPQLIAKPRGPIRISGGVIAGNILTKAPLVYPLEAKAAGVSGTVALHAIISKDGLITKLTVVSGPDLLQNAAIDAVKQWTYKPYLLNGQPTEVDTMILVNFSLNKPQPRPSPSDN
jgi:protein TonB